MTRRTLTALLVALVVLPVACSSGADGSGTAAPGGSPEDAPATSEEPRWPLTHLPGADASGLDRPFLWVKIDNAPVARPQIGLDKADVVIEEMVEGGLTRFMAVFHSTGSDPIGPVRSVRPVDADIVAPYGGLFAYSGGAKKYADLLHTTSVQDVGADSAFGTLYFRDRSRRAPNNQFARTSDLLAAGRGDQPPAKPLFEYVPDTESFPGDGIDAGPVTTVRLDLPKIVIGFRWDPTSKRWLRSTDGKPHVTAEGGQLGFDNVVLQFTPYTASTDKDAGGHDVPLAEPIGTNRAWFLANNRVYEGEWSKPSRTAPVRYTTKQGDDARLVPGRTIVVLVPTQTVPVTS